ncbi:MAG TPA: GNAT family N-acetyltransferase [Intrasporangium sp.]|nr:GNAT family N-acetyltransferase [Intrasporangium sp.]
MSDVSILPVTPERFDDVVELFGTRGDPSWCWCQYFVTSGDSYQRSARHNKRQLRVQVQSATRPIGLVAYAAEPASRRAGGPSGAGSRTPVGWVRVGPRPSFVRVTGNRALRALAKAEHDDLGDESVWAITCFVVKVGWRRRGIAAELLEAAVELARESGASAVVGHPVDVAARSTRVGGSELYHGTASTFAAAGFEVVGRTGATRPVMRLDLTH